MYYIKSKKIDDTYDYNEDLFPGLYGEIHKLPIIPSKQYPIIPSLNIQTDFKVNINEQISKNINKNSIKDLDITPEDYETKEHINAVCQHIISWDKLDELKKNNDVRFSSLVYEFLQQYININPDQEYICKSCKSSVNIKKYILDGTYDNLTNSFITFSIHMDVNIEDLPQYEKYKTSIRNLEKTIERISSILNIQGLNGTSYSNKIKRKNIVKDIIDTILIHNNYLKKFSYLSNRDKLIQKYGINKNFSNLYIFELDNNVFIYSSKEKDFYKDLKFNNIITYVLIQLIIEMNDTQIISLNNDKMCNYYFYKKVGFNLFNDIKIVVNKSHDIQPITNYPILCYLFFIVSCFITKYHLWTDTLSTEKNVIDVKKKLPIFQKSIINTLVEILNSMLDVNIEEQKENKIYLYEVFQTKYYLKLDMYKDPELIRKLDKMYLQEFSVRAQSTKIIDSNKFDITPNNQIFNNLVNDDLYQQFSKKYCLQRLIPPLYTNKFVSMNEISNLSNCIDGHFHTFQTKNENIICTNCNESANPKNLITDSIKIIGKRYNILYLRKLANKYCKSGLVHQFEYNSEQDINICKKCNYKLGSPITYTDSELYQMYNIIENIKKENNIKVNNIIKNLQVKNNDEISKIKKNFNKIVYKFQKYDNNINKSIDILLDEIQKLLGIDIVINNNTFNLYHNIYIIDHDYNGNKLDTPIYVYEKENKFRIIDNHPHFKRGVLIYTMQKNTKYELFYDLQEKYLLGYREINKSFIDIHKSQIKIKINYSIKNMLLLFGFTRQQINIRDFYPEIFGMTLDDFKNKFDNFNINILLNKIANRRLNIIKILGMELNKYINRFKYNYKINIITFESTYSTNLGQEISNTYINDFDNNPLDLLYTKYQKKIDNNIVTEVKDKNNLHSFLKYINDINLYLPFENINIEKNTMTFTEIIDYNFIIKHDFVGNFTLNYIIDEIIRLINYNINKNTKSNIIHFIIDIISIIFNKYNYEVNKFNTDVNYFHQVLYTSEFYLETQKEEYMTDTIDYYENQEQIKNFDNLNEEDKDKIIDEIDIDNEEIESMDVDEEIDAEGVFDVYSNYNFMYQE